MTAQQLYPHQISVGVVGAGLIGGSVVRRCQSTALNVVVHERDLATVAAVREAGVTTVDSIDELVGLVDLIVIAVPPSATVDIWTAVADAAQRQGRNRAGRVIVIDVASAKAPLVAALSDPSDWSNSSAVFALTHPMAGREVSGWSASQDTLFHEAAWIVCPHQGIRGLELAAILSFVHAMGARACFMSTDAHDQFAAMTSHLPHLVAFAYRDLLEMVDPYGTWWRFGGGSLADLLRVADADPQLWQDILASNEQELVSAAEALIGRIRLGWPAPVAVDGAPDVAAPTTLTIADPELPLAQSELDMLWESGARGLEVFSVTAASAVVIELAQRGESPIRHQQLPSQR